MCDPNRVCLLLLGVCCILGITGERCWYYCSDIASPMVVLVIVGGCPLALEGAVRLIKLKADWVYSRPCRVTVSLQTPRQEAGFVLDLLRKDGLVVDTVLGGVPNLVVYL